MKGELVRGEMMADFEQVREAAVAGRFYPADPRRLQAMVDEMLADAPNAGLPDVRALIVPHAGYLYSGPVAASGFRQLQDRANDHQTVYLLGPAHYVPVSSIALAPFAAFDTPLGQIPQDQQTLKALAGLGSAYALEALPHEPEHCLEVELPFLQRTLGESFELAALLCGRPPVDQVAHDLAELLRPDDLVIVSSDLSHFYSYDQAVRLDRRFLDAVLAGDLRAAGRGEACGLQPVLILMRLAQLKGWQPRLLDYRNSGDTGGDRQRVVGYAAVAYTEPTAH